MKMSELEQVLLHDLSDAGLLAGMVQEFIFSQDRKWRADFAWPDKKILVEVEGGQWKMGRHQRPDGFAKDCEKYNNAQMLGYQIYRFTGDMVWNRAAVNTIKAVLGR